MRSLRSVAPARARIIRTGAIATLLLGTAATSVTASVPRASHTAVSSTDAIAGPTGAITATITALQVSALSVNP